MWGQQMWRRDVMRIRLFPLLALSVIMGSGASVFADPLDANRLYNQGVDFYGKGNTQQAIQLFEKALREDPKYVDAYYNLGSVYFQAQQYEKSRNAFSRVLELNPEDSQAKYNLALALEKLGQNDRAIATLRTIDSSDRKYLQASQKLEQLQGHVRASGSATKSTALKPDTRPRNSGFFNWGDRDISPSAKKTSKSSTASRDTVKSAVKPPKAVKVVDAKKDESKKTVETYANGFFGPTGMALTPDGSLLVANYSKNLIYRVSPSGDKTVYAEGEGLQGPLGLAFDSANGVLYVANYLGSNVVRITPMGKVSVLASGLNKPYNLLLDTQKKLLYVTEQETNTVSKILLNP